MVEHIPSRVEDWMSAPLVHAPVDATIESLARLMCERRIRHVPLVREDGRCIGVVCDSEVFATGAFVADDTWMERTSKSARDLARPIGPVLHHSDELPYALAAMDRAESDHALVLNEMGRPIGIFTEHDAVRAGAALLPPHMKFVANGAVECVPRTAPASEALSRMVAAQNRHIVVLDDRGAACGVLSFRDVVAADDDLTSGEVMPAGPLHTMPPDSPLRWLSGEMARFRIGCVVELDLRGAPVGIVTRTDIARALLTFYDASSETTPWHLPPADVLASF